MSPGSSETRLAFWAQLGSLLLTGWITWMTVVGPRLRRQSVGALIGEALAYSVLVWVASAIIAFGIYLSLPATDRGDMFSGALRTSTTAVWFAPAMLLMTRSSSLALIASLALVVSTTRLLYAEWNGDPGPPATPLAALGWSMASSLCIHLSGVGFLMQIRLLAAPLLVTAAAMMTMLAIIAGAWTSDRPPTIPRAFLGAILTVLLSAGLTVGGLSTRRALPGENAAEGTHTPTDPPPGLYSPPAGDFPGVVLWPEVKHVTRLVAPLRRPGAGGKFSQPFRFSFGGEYWMTRFRSGRPPVHSFMQRGSPTSLAFSTTDRTPLYMQARQRLDEPIDLRCCRAIAVEILNADRYPSPIALDLFTVDSSGYTERLQLLGTAVVKSAPNEKEEPVTPVRETLEFPISPALADPVCTQLKIDFRRAPSRSDKSARISIEEFVLIPR